MVSLGLMGFPLGRPPSLEGFASVAWAPLASVPGGRVGQGAGRPRGRTGRGTRGLYDPEPPPPSLPSVPRAPRCLRLRVTSCYTSCAEREGLGLVVTTCAVRGLLPKLTPLRLVTGHVGFSTSLTFFPLSKSSPAFYYKMFKYTEKLKELL